MRKTTLYLVAQKERTVNLKAGRLAEAINEMKRRRLGCGLMFRIQKGQSELLGNVEALV